MTIAKPTLEVAAGIIWKGGLFLAAKRPEGKDRAGFWEFPGGKREPGESLEDTLRRELREELSIDCGRIVPWRTIAHEYSELRVELAFMHVLEFRGEPRPNDGQELRWVSPDEARNLPFLPADVAVVNDIRPPLPSILETP
jgi:8-oxo-dGTP diphosphatase